MRSNILLQLVHVEGLVVLPEHAMAYKANVPMRPALVRHRALVKRPQLVRLLAERVRVVR